MCAGPYSQSLLGIDHEMSKKFEEEMVSLGTQSLRQLIY